MKRLGLLIAAGMLVALLPATAASGGSGETADVSVVHGIGPAPNTVDVYLGAEDAVTWDLIIDDMDYGELEDLGAIDPGVYNVLICAGGDGTTPITGALPCGEAGGSAVNSNVGTNVEAAPGADTTFVAAYGDPSIGRPTVLAFENDLECVDAGEARVTAAHAATAGEVNVIADGTELFGDLAYSESQAAVVEEGEYDIEVELAADDSPVVAVSDVPLDALRNTVLYVVGNPQFDADFDVIGVEITIPECPVDTPPVPVTPATPVAPVPVAVPASPAFTG